MARLAKQCAACPARHARRRAARSCVSAASLESDRVLAIKLGGETRGGRMLEQERHRDVALQ